jgi:hypothetical protein
MKRNWESGARARLGSEVAKTLRTGDGSERPVFRPVRQFRPFGVGFQAGVTVQVYLETSNSAVANTASAITDGISSWNQVSGVIYTIHQGSVGYLQSTDVNNPTWYIIAGDVPQGKDGVTTAAYYPGQAAMSYITTLSPAFLAQSYS